MSAQDFIAMAAVEGGPPMIDNFDGFYEAFPPRGLTMEEWCEADASAQAYGPDVFTFDGEGDE